MNPDPTPSALHLPATAPFDLSRAKAGWPVVTRDGTETFDCIVEETSNGFSAEMSSGAVRYFRKDGHWYDDDEEPLDLLLSLNPTNPAYRAAVEAAHARGEEVWRKRHEQNEWVKCEHPPCWEWLYYDYALRSDLQPSASRPLPDESPELLGKFQNWCKDNAEGWLPIASYDRALHGEWVEGGYGDSNYVKSCGRIEFGSISPNINGWKTHFGVRENPTHFRPIPTPPNFPDLFRAQHPVATPPASGETGKGPFQQRVFEWLMACFSMEICRDQQERNHRFLEESLELVQSLGCTASEAHQLVDYVFGREVGEPNQECGGVMVTLAALCFPAELDMAQAGETELARVWTKIEKIRAKQAAKPKHSPLPEKSGETGTPRTEAFVHGLRRTSDTPLEKFWRMVGEAERIERDLAASRAECEALRQKVRICPNHEIAARELDPICPWCQLQEVNKLRAKLSAASALLLASAEPFDKACAILKS